MLPSRTVTDREADAWAADLSDFQIGDYLRAIASGSTRLPVKAKNALLREAGQRLYDAANRAQRLGHRS